MKLTLIDDINFGSDLDQDFHTLTRLVDEQLGTLPGQLNLILCGDEKIQELNKAYRKKDKVTDVLTFPYFEGETQADELLGEIYIDVDQARRQAGAVTDDKETWYHEWMFDDHKSWTVSFEMYKLCSHGLLHLRGYDHIEDDDFRVMKLLEDKIMKSLMASH
ncbi:MAG: rRNA maturation RNase YbeY [Candidatus Gracilibacteria bacterium]|nr:rRNA maturation RNase YbeY [Candidatus Gracilibacteria bacterium]